MSEHNFDSEAINLHSKLKGKIRIQPSTKVGSDRDLSVVYTPGVGAVSKLIAQDRSLAKDMTISSGMVAVISDGSAVLGLGNVGAEAALPVMEGKAMLFKELAGVDAFPICLNTQDTEQIIQTIKNIAPVFAGINLEDIAAPKCFEIENRLNEELGIPVIHDDQHATAIVTLAGVINALKVVGKDKADCRAVIIGAGAAGSGVARLLQAWGMGDITVVDSKGILSSNREDLIGNKLELSKITNKKQLEGNLKAAIKGSDIVIGLSTPGTITKEDIKSMNDKPIIFAMANPVPEIDPNDAKQTGAAVVATGRSDYPNQINNVLVFPGMFRGAIANGIKSITDDIKLRAAQNLAELIKEPNSDRIIPSVFDDGVVDAVVSAFKA